MLIEFSVSNFKSIREEACLSLVAGKGREHRETHLVIPELQEGSQYDPLVRSAAVFGANAAGKSNLLGALEIMKMVVLRSYGEPKVLQGITPFKFHPVFRNQATVFEVICIAEGVRYQYGFEACAQRVDREWLYAWPRGRVQRWLERDGQDWKLGAKLRGDKRVWRRATRDNALFLSTAAALNSEQLRPLFNWFVNVLQVAGRNVFDLLHPLTRVYSQGARKEDLLAFLRSADLAIADVRIGEGDISSATLDDVPGPIREWIMHKEDSPQQGHVFLRHNTPLGGAELRMAEESAGTQKVFRMAGPWLHALHTGQVVVMDGLNDSLHPAWVKYLVDQFHDPARNVHGAQLVFSAHDTHILNQETFRRDQVWFCERNPRQETQVYALTEFRPRKGWENLELSYLGGRYGAIPRIRPTACDNDL